jgi:hypothetical protein
VGSAVQGVGPIDWWGPPKKASKPTGDKYILSYWGPNSRHFPTVTFSYGSSQKHNEVYYEGRVCAIAPGPVIGACLQPIAGNTSKYWIIVVAWVNGKENVYRRELKAYYFASKVTDAERQQLMKLYDSENNPDGWRTVGSVLGAYPELGKPETPWFFNQSGTEAQCIRRRQVTFDSGGGAGSSTEIRNDRYKLTLSTSTGQQGDIAGSVSSTREYSPDPYLYTEEVKKHRSGVWTSPPDSHGVTHEWLEDYATVTVKHTGRQPVAVDYVGDTLLACDLVISVNNFVHQDWMIGVDAPGAPYTNYNQLQNYQPGSYTNEPRGHQATTWTNLLLDNYLEWGSGGLWYRTPIEAMQDMTKTQYDSKGTADDPSDRFRFYTEHFRTYPRYLDLRKYLMQARVTKYDEFLNGVIQYRNSDYEVYDREEGDYAYTVFMEKEPVRQIAAQAQGWSRTDMLTWDLDFEYTWTKTSFVGARPTDNDNEEKGKAAIYKFYTPIWTTIKEGWKGVNLLRHDYFTTEMGIAQTSQGDYLISMRIPDFRTSTNQLVNVLGFTGEVTTLTTITGGERFYPLGVA